MCCCFVVVLSLWSVVCGARSALFSFVWEKEKDHFETDRRHAPTWKKKQATNMRHLMSTLALKMPITHIATVQAYPLQRRDHARPPEPAQSAAPPRDRSKPQLFQLYRTAQERWPRSTKPRLHEYWKYAFFGSRVESFTFFLLRWYLLDDEGDELDMRGQCKLFCKV